MPIVHVPQRRTPDPWSRLQRFFRFEGRLGGLRYGVRLEVRELTPPGPPAPGRELRPEPGEPGPG